MATIIADCILSPLGLSASDTLDAILAGKTGLKRHAPVPGLPFDFTASIFSGEMEREFMVDGFSRFESLALTSIRKALADCDVPFDRRTVFILSSTKGNIGDYDGVSDFTDIILPASAAKLAEAIGVTTTPLTVCNACVSGVSALALAHRLLSGGEYDYAIVCGADVQSPFIISGFHSLKALDLNECRPFDIERLGLNLGEAAATVVLKADDTNAEGQYRIVSASSRNDAMHITNPSPSGEGCMQAIKAVMADNDTDIALINAHGTATMYNDQMESKAISRAGLGGLPVNALKGYLGHTMGAAGIVETVLTMHALEKGVILPTRGFEEIGVSGKIDVTREMLHTSKTAFLKIISGFGGCNCAVLLDKKEAAATAVNQPNLSSSRHVRLTPAGAFVDGKKVSEETGASMLTAIYKSEIGDYPKFYKMDSLSRLAFVATELLLKYDNGLERIEPSSRAVVFFSHSGSIKTDTEYISTIKSPDAFFPSPSLFVYTLPNITAGEVAIRNHYNDETLFIMLENKDWAAMEQVNRAMMLDASARSLVSGWIEYIDDLNFEADIHLFNKI